MKACFKCGEEKPLSEYYKHKQMSDGHLNKCKSCTKKDVYSLYNSNKNDKNYIIKERKRGRDKYRRLYTGKGKANKDSFLRYKNKYPEKYRASIKCRSIKEDYDSSFELHHWSYNEEHHLDIIPIIKKEHMKAHRFIVYDQERMMYRRYDNNILLDTKESHTDFIFSCIRNEED
jgi:hypothetical protein